MTDEDTIVAVASPAGRAARGIVRLSGEHAFEVASGILAGEIAPGTYTVAEARLSLPATAPFPVLVYVMRAPRSYTREDVVEIHAPGSPPLLAAIAAETCRRGARMAEPGEFTRRAFLNGRIDLAQAEAVLALIRARSDDEERLALSILGGDLSAEVRAIRARLMDLAVDLEAGLDFAEEDVTFADEARQARDVDAAARAADALLAKSVTREVFREEVLAVIFGPANAGKSSLFNALARCEHSLVSATPGTTRDFLETVVRIGAVEFFLVDTAGVRTPEEAVEAVAVEQSRRFAREARIVLFVADGSSTPSPDALALYEEAARLPRVVALNKSDIAPAASVDAWKRALCGAEIVEVSAKTGEGLRLLEAALAEAVEGGRVDLSTMRFQLAARQRRLVEDARDALARARAEVGRGEELVAASVREAAEALSRVTGEDYVGDVLDEVFSRFCLGK